MKLSQIAASLGLDEIAAVRPVPLTDDEIARHAMATPAPNRAERRAAERKRESRHVRNAVGGGK